MMICFERINFLKLQSEFIRFSEYKHRALESRGNRSFCRLQRIDQLKAYILGQEGFEVFRHHFDSGVGFGDLRGELLFLLIFRELLWLDYKIASIA